ncbi:unnamed protein product [Callosobruchus maculatus]|uniref:Uncharacterized protein n=1 Tax=Callosobruchus maculatus TaxID=64391 RepID=A0A653DM96_CALMS|nr:unnamed protein product [Callosobruchus maculatus]
MSFSSNALRNVVAKAGPSRAYHVKKTMKGYVLAPSGRRKIEIENPYQQQKVRQRSKMVNEAMLNKQKQLWIQDSWMQPAKEKKTLGLITAILGTPRITEENLYQQRKIRERSKIMNEAMLNKQKQLWVKCNTYLWTPTWTPFG